MAREGVRVYTVGVGSVAGELIPVPDAHGGTSFVRDPSGQFVKSRLDEAGLREVAEATGGFYEPLGAQGEGLVAVWHRGLESMAKTELAGRLRRVPHERFQWPLAFGILCLLIEMLVREGTRRATVRAAAAAVLLALMVPPSALASPQSAARAWEAGDWARAAAEWRDAATHDPSDLRLRFNEGAAAYRAGDLPAATAAFGKALETEHVPLQQQAYYNLGNSQFRLGERSEQSNPQETVGAWQAALKAYDGALRLDPKDDDARFNRELVQKKLEELQRRMEQQKQEQQKQQDQQQEQGQQQDQQQQNQQQQAGQPQQSEQQKADEAQAKSQGEKPPQEQKPQPAGQQPTPREGGDQKPQGDAAAKAAAREMTPEEARALLDSLRGDVRAVPLGQDARPTPDDAGRDW